MAINRVKLMAKYSQMTPDELKQEWQFWVKETAWWEQIQASIRDKGMMESFTLCGEAMADNQQTIELIESFLDEDT